MLLLKQIGQIVEPELNSVFCRAVAEVESGSIAFVQNGKPTIYFDLEYFTKNLKHLPNNKMQKVKVFKGHNYQTFKAAQKIDSRNAYMSSYVGLFRIPLTAAKYAGFSSLFSFMDYLQSGKDAQIIAFKKYALALGAEEAINSGNVNDFTVKYHDSSFLETDYPERLKKALQNFLTKFTS